MFQDVALRKVTLTAGQACPQTVGIYTGSGGDIVVVLWNDQLNIPPGTPEVPTTLAATNPGCWLPISIAKYISGPANAVGFTL